jgi:parallel beta-helix repeat protein
MDARGEVSVPRIAVGRLVGYGRDSGGASMAELGTRSHRVPSRHRVLAVAAALALVAVVAPASAAAAPTETITCGEVVTHSIVVGNDLNCGSVNQVWTGGLKVGADDITIDLSGHAINAAWAPALSSTGHSDVTIEHGSLGDNAIALTLTGDRHDVVRDVTAEGGAEGSGLWLSGGSQNSVLDSTLCSCGPVGYAGLELDNENGDMIADNTVQTWGLVISGGAGNQVTHNTTPRIDVTSSGNLIEGNVIGPDSAVYGDGLVIDGDQNNVVGNQVSSSAVAGQLMQFPEGISVTGSANVLSGNTAADSAGDGIHVLAAGNTLTANVANNNGTYGIEAVAGVIDGGQNRASGNGNPAECLNIVCSAPAPQMPATPTGPTGPTGPATTTPGPSGVTHHQLSRSPAIAAAHLTRLEITGRSFRAARSGPGLIRSGSVGVVFTYHLSNAATVTFRVERQQKIHGHTRWTMLTGSFSWKSSAGTTRLRFTGRIAGRTLPSGRYRLVLTPHDRKGHTTPPILSNAFTIKH